MRPLIFYTFILFLLFFFCHFSLFRFVPDKLFEIYLRRNDRRDYADDIDDDEYRHLSYRAESRAEHYAERLTVIDDVHHAVLYLYLRLGMLFVERVIRDLFAVVFEIVRSTTFPFIS